MKKVLAMLLRPPVPQLAGLLVLSAVVYYGGRALSSWHGQSDNTLLLIVAGIWVLAALLFVWRRLQARKRARMIEDRLRGQAREHKQSVRPDKRNQVEELERQLGDALTALKSSKLGNSALYSLPWYIIIGPPGSGKTTLLRESGLTFPQQTHGRGVRGVGGTRNCDWWFTDQGILLDTAGRYTTQDEDKGEWLSFLDMLKKSRSKKPINGAIIAISIADIVTASDDQLAEHARKVRERLAELTARLEVLFPVYVMFSKCDLLDGFVDLFGGYGKQERSQVWGFTLPYLEKGAMPLADRFDREFEQLHARLCVERLKVLGTARSQAKKARIFSFPMQFAMARERLRSFLSQVDQPNPYSESSEIRGFYFTSGTQEGQPLDRVLSQMRKATGLAEEAEDGERDPVDKKAYFIDELFTEVVFPDRNLAQSSAKAERRRLLLHRGGMIGTGIAALCGVVLLVTQYVHHSDVIRRAKTAFDDAVAFDPAVPADIGKEEDFHNRGGGPLERLRRMFVELAEANGTIGSRLIGQVDQLYLRRIRPLYVGKLQKTFLQPLQERLRGDLQAVVDDPKRVNEDTSGELNKTLALYRMLGGKTLPPVRTFLSEQLVGSRWTWTRDAERPPCPPHRDTFLGFIVETADDWQVQALEDLLEKAGKQLETRSTFDDEVVTAATTGRLKARVTWTEILANYTEARLLDPSVGIAEAYRQHSEFLETLSNEGNQRGGEQGGELVQAGRFRTGEEWRKLLAEIRPIPRDNVKEAMDDVAKLTEGTLYVKVYEKVCETLSDLGTETPAGQTDWLRTLLAEINKLKVEVATLVETGPVRSNILELTSKEQAKLTNLTMALRRVRSAIGSQVPTSARLTSDIKSALLNLVRSVEYGLAAEIVVGANVRWGRELGKTLGEISTQFPFKATANALPLDPGVFDRTFAKGGEFDKGEKWIGLLEEQLDLIGQSGPTLAFRKDREAVLQMQRALFAGDRAQREVEFRFTKHGQSSAVVFELDKVATKATRATTKGLVWKPSDGASITIEGFLTSGGPIPAKLKEEGAWGLVRLIAKGTTTIESEDDVQFYVCHWDRFTDDAGVRIIYNDKPAEAKLRYRTLSEPNPLAPDFFTHEFATEVFETPIPPGGRK